VDGTFGLDGQFVQSRVEMVTKGVLDYATNLYLLTEDEHVTGVQAMLKLASTNTVRV